MDLLVISNNPARPSYRQRVGIYLETLHRADIVCEAVRLPSGLFARRKLFSRAAEFDGVLLHKKKLNFLDASRLRRHCRRLIYDFDDAIMYNPDSPERNSISHSRPFYRTVKLADMVIAGNSYLAEHAARFNNRVEVLPTGLDTGGYRHCAGIQKDGRVRLVWIGSRSTLKYLAGIKPALEEIGRHFDNVILRIVCDDFFELDNMEVEKHQWQRDTEIADLVTADIALAPLPDNRFTRGKCGFKILQYASAGLPVVASPVGVNSDYVHDGVTGFWAAGTQQWVDKISQLVETPQLRKQMGDEGLVQAKRFDIGIIGQKLTALIKECLRSTKS